MLGPIFARELAITACKGRSYALRSAFGLALLAVIATTYRNQVGAGLDPRPVAHVQITQLARALFQDLLLAQGVAVFWLTPGLVAGAIAGEAQRKTLGDLLTTDLTDAEIVVGKLAARLVPVAVLVAVGLPIVLCAGMLGGVDLVLVALAELATLSTAFFLGALAVLGSTQTRSVRGAMNFVFTLALTWLILPGAIGALLPRMGGFGSRLYEWLTPVNAWVAPTSPFAFWVEAMQGAIRGPDALRMRVLGMIGLQVLYGALLAWCAVACLRPSFRARSGGRRRRGVERASQARRPDRPARRVPCSDDPMLWKELFVPRVPLFYRPLGRSIALVLGGLLIWGTLDFAWPAFRELWAGGYGVAAAGSARGRFHLYLRIVGTGVSLVTALGVASDAAAGMTTERERDTWISLIATPLTGAEIVRAKLLGAVWGARHTVAVFLLLGMMGVLAGSIHPAGLVLTMVELAAFSGFAAALGTWTSLRSQDTKRAVERTMAGLLLVSGGSALLLVPMLALRPLALVGCAPALLAASLASHGEFLGLATANALGAITDAPLSRLWVEHWWEMLVAGVVSVLGYAAGAYALTKSACRGFDALLDRPARSEGEERIQGGGPGPHAQPRLRLRQRKRSQGRV